MAKKTSEKGPTAARGGIVTNVGVRKQRITWNQGTRGRNIRMIVNGTRETAEKILHQLREEFYAGRHGIHVDHDTTVKQLAQLVEADYRANGFKDIRNALIHKNFWTTLCGDRRAESIDAEQLTDWAQAWRADGLSAARVNRRMAFLLRGFRLAEDKSQVNGIPKWTALKEAPPRSGTRSWEEFVKVRALLPDHARVPVSIEYHLGTRSSETHALEWPQVRFQHSKQLVEIRLKSIDTKTGQPRVALMGGDLYYVLRDWREMTKSSPCSTVCSLNERPLRSIRTAWQTACVRSGLGRWLNPDGAEVGNRKYRGALIHDFRRTAVSRMEDAGIPRKVAMAISGHKTDSVYRRYHIVRTEDLAKAGRQLLAHHEQEHGPTDGSQKVFSYCSVGSQKGSDRTRSGRNRAKGQNAANAAPIASKRRRGARIA